MNKLKAIFKGWLIVFDEDTGIYGQIRISQYDHINDHKNEPFINKLGLNLGIINIIKRIGAMKRKENRKKVFQDQNPTLSKERQVNCPKTRINALFFLTNLYAIFFHNLFTRRNIRG